MIQRTFTYRLDFYWQSVAAYALTLVIYALIRGAFIEDHFVVVLYDPVLYLLTLCVVWSLGSLVTSAIARRRLTVEKDALVFENRFRRWQIERKDIIWVKTGREKRMKIRGSYSVVKIKISSRRRVLRIRPSLFSQEEELIAALQTLTSQKA